MQKYVVEIVLTTDSKVSKANIKGEVEAALGEVKFVGEVAVTRARVRKVDLD